MKRFGIVIFYVSIFLWIIVSCTSKRDFAENNLPLSISNTLIMQLIDDDIIVREKAYDEFVSMGRAAVPTMITLLKGENLALREAAADILLEIGPEAEEAISVLIDLIKDDNETLRSASAFALISIKKSVAITSFIEALNNNKVEIRITAAEALNVLGAEAKNASKALNKALYDENYKVRIYAAATMLSLDASQKKALMIISNGLQSKDVNVRVLTVMAISSAEVRSHDLVPLLLECARDGNETVRYFAIEALGLIGDDSPEKVGLLIERIKNEDIGIGEKASIAEALVNIGKPAVPPVIKLLDNTNDDVRLLAVRVLGNIGPEADEAIPFLLSKLRDEDQIAIEAGIALARIGGKKVVPALAKRLEDSDAEVRKYAALTLGYMGADASESLSSLTKCLDDEEARVRASAAIAIGSIGTSDAHVIKKLENLLKDENAGVRHWAADAIKRLKEKAGAETNCN